jgi:hypothetical protein
MFSDNTASLALKTNQHRDATVVQKPFMSAASVAMIDPFNNAALRHGARSPYIAEHVSSGCQTWFQPILFLGRSDDAFNCLFPAMPSANVFEHYDAARRCSKTTGLPSLSRSLSRVVEDESLGCSLLGGGLDPFDQSPSLAHRASGWIRRSGFETAKAVRLALKWLCVVTALHAWPYRSLPRNGSFYAAEDNATHYERGSKPSLIIEALTFTLLTSHHYRRLRLIFLHDQTGSEAVCAAPACSSF